MNQSATTVNVLRRAAWTTVLGLLAGPVAIAGDVSVDIRIGGHAPPPAVVVVEREPVVYETYVVGYRRNLYDADLRLRLARADEWQAHEEMGAARRREGEIAVQLDETEAVIGDLRKRVGGGEASAAAVRERAAATAELCADLGKKVEALHHRVKAAREDFDAAKTLNDRDGMAEASERMKSNEAKEAGFAIELREAEGRLAHLREEEAALATAAADRARLHEAEERGAVLRHDLDVSHDAVYNCQKRLTDAQEAVCAAVHDRDEALWLLHRDDIYAGRIDAASCGFSIDLAVWGGRLPRDPEVVHAYLVREPAYWRSNPVLIEERVVIAERAPEVVRVREIQHVREERVRVVERVEVSVKVEDRRRVAEAVVVERTRYEAETVERKTAVTEHRALRPVYIERPANVNNVTSVNNGTVVNNTTNNRNSNNTTIKNSNNTTVNSKTVNNVTNVTNVTKVQGGDPKEEAKLRADAERATKAAEEAKKSESATADRAKRDEAKLSEQQKQIDTERRDQQKTADEVAKLKAAQDKSARADDKAAAKGTDKTAAARPADKSDKSTAATADRSAAADPKRGAAASTDTDRGSSSSSSSRGGSRRGDPAAAAPPPPPPDTSANRNRRGGDPAPAPATDPRTSKDRGAADPRAGTKGDPRSPRDGQANTDDPNSRR